ncbi:hypothetical protein BGZ83_006784 [Gryganskiella cystojenkinii]|nr:hypothetical protein BGZ83_006784 [Gryganskiella cystojenkinii]
MLFPSTGTILVATLAIISTITTPSSFTTVDAHSWADCIDWRPSNGKNSKNIDWNKGSCFGYARRFPLKGAFGSLDSADPSRHYQQAGNPSTALPCSDHKHGKDVGSDETKASPVSGAYGGKWGRMTVAQVGDTLCVRWPAKNHAEKNEDNTKVQINFSKVKDGKDPNQQTLLKNTIALLPYKNCNPGKNPDRRACGGCFKVPARASGTYLMQWRWMLNPGEWYTSCADIQIGGLGGSVQNIVKNLGGAIGSGNGSKNKNKGSNKNKTGNAKGKIVCRKVYKHGKQVGRKCQNVKN